MNSQAETLFSCRIVTADYYLAPPVKGLDVCHSDLTSSAVERAPVIRIFGATPAGQKCCVHVHGVFPYIHVPCPGNVPADRSYLQQLASSIDSALQLSAGHVSSRQKFNYVYKIIVVKGIPFYGYHKHEELFLRIYLYSPATVTRLADLLTAGAVMQQPFQSHDAHIPFILQFFIDFHLYGMNFIHFETVRFRVESSPTRASPTTTASKMTSESCEPEACLLSTSSSSSRSCDLVATPSQKYWSMQDIESEMISSLSKVSSCELECDGLAVHITNKAKQSTTSFSDNPGIAALWHDEKIRREWKGLSEDLVAPPSPVREHPVQCFAAEQRHKEILHHAVQDSLSANSSPEDVSDPSLDSMVMSQSCDVTAHVMVGNASHQEQQQPQQSVTVDTIEPVVDMETVEQLTQLSQRLSSSTVSHCSDQELLELLQQLAQTNSGDNSTQNNIASQVIRNSQGISPSIISSSSCVSVTSSPLDVATPSKETDDTLTPPGGSNNDTLGETNDDTIIHMDEHYGTDPQTEALSYKSDSILFQDSPRSMGGALNEGGANDTVQFTAEQRAQVISLCSHGNEEDLQLDNTYHCSLDEFDASMIIDDVIECENDVMSQPWSSEQHQQIQQKEYFTEDIPDIEDIWTSSFVDQIPQLDGAGDKGPPPKTCYGLRQRQFKKSYEDRIRPRSHSVWKPFKPPAQLAKSCDPQSKSYDPQSKSCDPQNESCDHPSGSGDQQDVLFSPQNKPNIIQSDDILRLQILTKSLFPYVKKLSPNEISSIKDGLQQKRNPPLNVTDQGLTAKQSSDHLDHQTKASNQIHEDSVKKRLPLSLKRRRRKQDTATDVQEQSSPFKKRKFSPVKKLDLTTSRNEQDLVAISQLSQDCSVDMENTISSTVDEPSSRYHPLHFVAAKEPVTNDCCVGNDSPHHHHDNDKSDALLNMGYLSPIISTHTDPDCKPDMLHFVEATEPVTQDDCASNDHHDNNDSDHMGGMSQMLSVHIDNHYKPDEIHSPLKSSSPVSSCDSPSNTSFTLVLPSSSSSASEDSSSSHSDGSPSRSPSPTFFYNIIESVIIRGQQQYDKLITAAGSHDQEGQLLKGSFDQVIVTPLDDDTISYISESPKSKLPCSEIPISTDDDNTCIIVPALTPPTSSHLLATLDQYSLPHVVHEQPFCSKPQDVPPAKYIGSKTIKIPSKMVYELPEFKPVYTSGCGSFASTGIMHWRTVLGMFSSTGEELPPPPSGGSCTTVEQYENEGKQRASHCPNKYCVITPAKLPPCPKKLLYDINDMPNAHGNQIHTSTPAVTKKATREQSVSLTPIKGPPVTKVKRKISTGGQSLDHSELSGPSLGSSYDFKISPAMGDQHDVAGSDYHKVQYLTVMSVEVHTNTRGGLNPDPQFDTVMAICYHVNNDWSLSNSNTMATTHQYTGVIAITPSTTTDPCNNDQGKIQSDFLSLSGLPTELEVSYVDSEEALLIKLVELVRRYDADILIGYEVQKSSWGYLMERAAALNINLTGQLSRIPASDDSKAYKPRNNSETSGAIEFARRIIQHEVALTSYTFENTFYHVLHQRTAKYSFQTLTRWYSKTEPLYCGRVLQYYLLRCVVNYDLLEKFNLIGRTSEFARLYGILFYSVLSRGTQFRVESMMLRLAKPRNFIAVSPSVQQRARMAAPESLPLILEPESRFYADPVVVLDFQSLYPSIIIAYNYCFSTCLGRVHYLELNDSFPFGATNLFIPRKTLKELINEDHVTVSPNGVVFVKDHVRRGIMPRMLEEILNTRVMVKQSMKLHKDDKTLGYILDARQLGLKLIANVTFGYTAASYSGRMPCVEISDSIISKARETLNRAIQLVNNTPRWGGRVVYGDTDSLFVLLKGASKEEAFHIGKEIVEAVTADNPKPVKLKFEKVYLPCVLQTKKRYVGYAYESVDQKEPIFDAKGIETVRRDGCPAVVKILDRSIKLLFNTKDISKVKSYVTRQCGRILNGRVSIGEYTFAREYRGKSGYRPGACVPALELTRESLAVDPRSEPLVGERVPYVIVYGPPGLPLIRLVKKPMDLLVNPTLRLNGEYYVTKQILPALNRVFSLVGVDVTKWYYELPRVFRVTKPPPTVNKGTIGQYFATIHCVVCGQLSVKNVCSLCTGDPQKVATVITNRIQSSETSYHQLLLLCSHCVASRDEHHIISCVSLDCPVLSRRLRAKHKLQTSAEMRSLLDELP